MVVVALLLLLRGKQFRACLSLSLSPVVPSSASASASSNVAGES